MQKTGSISFSVDLVPGKLEPLSLLPVELINPSVILTHYLIPTYR